MACERRDCEVETMLGRLPNGVVVLAAEIIVTTWIYFGKMSIEGQDLTEVRYGI